MKDLSHTQASWGHIPVVTESMDIPSQGTLWAAVLPLEPFMS